MTFSKKQWIFLAAAVVVALAVALLIPIEGLSSAGSITLGIFLGAIILWCGNVFPFVVTCLILMILLVVTKVVSFGTAFSGVSQTTWWLMLGAMGFSVALTKTGVLRRLSFHILKVFPSNFLGQSLAVALAGLVVNPMIPSVNVKIAMLMPMVKSISDTVGYPKRSKGAHGLWSVAYISIVLGSYAFATSNLFSIIVAGLLPSEGRADWIQWFLGALPWLVIAGIGTLVVAIIMFNPKDPSLEMSKDFIDEELKKMGKISRQEIICIVTLIAAVLLWIFEGQIGIPSQVTALMSMVVVLVLGVIDMKELKNGVPWDMLLMVGTLMGLGGVFAEVGLTDFITQVFTPVVNLVSGNIVIFLIAFSLIFSLVRMVVTDVITLFTIFIPLFIPFANALGISPWVLGFIALVSQTHWGMFYMSNFGIPAYGMWGGEEMLDYNQLAKPSWVYCVLNIVAIIVSIPFWKLIGFIA